ncbi:MULTISPECIES: hypothetical protein [unclassified Thiomonas]|uniref:hypothetical protein n=1 Tax=unclassified Thiomonas TaxID=2625466 RepID=UPI0012AAA96B|nr:MULTISPECIES: hypothetical protein [unclassified Thiomonas]VDY03367.1 protein of unknown function [Thiomonas sp. Bio17B3]VDY09459.1 protein of unknown function [Thiomonas sp. Sup16B3]VDY11615.1 conserved protein of unknown function [Thiomonas sp. OC7]VDY19170.1 protein of unknown function [Thiomonas sp. CB2]
MFAQQAGGDAPGLALGLVWVAVIDPHSARRTAKHDLAHGSRGNLLVRGSDKAVAASFKAVALLLNPVSDKILRAFNQVGGFDEVWFDSARGDFVLAAVGTLMPYRERVPVGT